MLVSFSDRHSPEIVTQTGITCLNRGSVKQQVYFGLSKFFSTKVASIVGNPREIKALLQSLISKNAQLKNAFPSQVVECNQVKINLVRQGLIRISVAQEFLSLITSTKMSIPLLHFR